MKTIRTWTAAGLLLAGLAAGTAKAQNTTFTLVNNTGFTVYSVYIWPTTSTYRGPDRLGDKIIESGESYKFRPEDDTCLYNIRVTVKETGDELDSGRVNLCSLEKFTLHYNYVEEDLWASRD